MEKFGCVTPFGISKENICREDSKSSKALNLFLEYREYTPDYKDKKIETEKAKTYNTPFLSLKRPDFKYVIFKIVEVS